MFPLILKTKYAFHALLWLLDPDVILDVGSMDGSDSKKFKRLTHNSEVFAFEANPDNYRAMCSDTELQNMGVQVVHQLVSNIPGNRSFYVQRPIIESAKFNRGTSSAMPSNREGVQTEEVHIEAVRIDTFLSNIYPDLKSAAMWVDVEGHAYEVLESLREVRDRTYLIHVEVETRVVWPEQKIESDILKLASSMGFVLVARGAHDVQRDLILIKESWYNAHRRKISLLLHISKLAGPILSKILLLSRQKRCG
jgi:FkbM family methyltransferase